MVQSFLVHTDIQKRWIEKFKQVEAQFKARAAEHDLKAQFPFENVQWLINEGYTKLTLPEAYGGEGVTIEDMVILQSYLGAIDGATALSIGWHLSVIGQIFQQQMWDPSMLQVFAREVVGGALVNRAVSEAETGSPTRGGRPLPRMLLRLTKDINSMVLKHSHQ